MTRSRLGTLLILLPAVALAKPSPEHAADYAKLDPLVGSWTIKGKEATYRETCAWYEGGFHVVCHAQDTRKDGSRLSAMSILGFVPGQGYVYTGIGDSGRYETLDHGSFVDGKIVYTSKSVEEGKTITTRISVGPLEGNRMPFVVDASSDGEPWAVVDTIEYLKLP